MTELNFLILFPVLMHHNNIIIYSNYKLIKHWGKKENKNRVNKFELYDLSTDISETVHISSTNPDIVQDLENRLIDFMRTTNAATYKTSDGHPFKRYID